MESLASDALLSLASRLLGEHIDDDDGWAGRLDEDLDSRSTLAESSVVVGFVWHVVGDVADVSGGV